MRLCTLRVAPDMKDLFPMREQPVAVVVVVGRLLWRSAAVTAGQESSLARSEDRRRRASCAAPGEKAAMLAPLDPCH